MASPRDDIAASGDRPSEPGQIKALWLGAAAWLRRRAPELALFLCGVCLRISMRFRYDTSWGYDAEAHWVYVDWLVKHRDLPPIETGRMLESFHPPLFYFVSALFATQDVSQANIAWVSILAGSLRLALIWWGLERFFPGSPWARRSALALAAVLPASIHLEGMLSAEPLNGLLAASAMLVAAPLFSEPHGRRWSLRALAVGGLLGLGMLTKISALVLIAAFGSALVLALWNERRSGLAALWVRLRPWPLALAACTAVSGWYFARNISQFGRPFITSFESTESYVMAGVAETPLFDRRSFGFVLGWSSGVYEFPYWPSSLQPQARFFPTVVASTFVDYWNYSFSGITLSLPAPFSSNGRPITAPLLAVSKGSMFGGTLIMASALTAAACSLVQSVRSRRWDAVALLLIPLLTLLAALKFAIQYPFDTHGVIKGAYLQFGFPPLLAMFGVAVAWSRQRPSRWPACAALLGSLGLVALYTLACRTGIGLTE